jgi:hypothetical protein
VNPRVVEKVGATYLDIGLRLVSYLHDELGFTLDHVLENGLVHPVRLD